MGNVLPLVGIAALMVVGFVILMTALTYDSRVRPNVPSDSSGKRGVQRKQGTGQVQRAMSELHNAVRTRAFALTKSAMRLRSQAIALAGEWWPRVRHHATDPEGRWLTLESTFLQVIVIAAVALFIAYAVVAFA
jgi:hypothetical protein